MSDTMVSAFSDALTTIQTDVFSMMTTALPIALAIVGVFIAIRLAVKFFRSVAK